jgi:hypothetical protein
LDSHIGPQRRQRLFEARRTIDDDQLRPRQSAPDVSMSTESGPLICVE